MLVIYIILCTICWFMNPPHVSIGVSWSVILVSDNTPDAVDAPLHSPLTPVISPAASVSTVLTSLTLSGLSFFSS